jgi:hypothetical protein
VNWATRDCPIVSQHREFFRVMDTIRDAESSSAITKTMNDAVTDGYLSDGDIRILRMYAKVIMKRKFGEA